MAGARGALVKCGHVLRTLCILPCIVASGIAALLELGGSASEKSGGMRGKTVVITGANTGIGKRTALRLAQLGATVVLACRNVRKGEGARQEIIAALRGAQVRVVELDLGSLVSVRECAKCLVEDVGHIDVLILNAGINANVPTSTHQDARCSTIFGVNFVAHWLLVHLLVDVHAKPPGKVVCLSSVMHHFADPAKFFDDDSALLGVCTADYAESKLAMILMARELVRRGIPAVAVNPGAVASDIWRHVWPWIKPLLNMVQAFFFLTADQGAATSVCAAADEDITHGYFSPYWQPAAAFCPGRSGFEFIGPFAGGRNHAYCRLPRDEGEVSANLWRKCESLCRDFVT